jgi:hypothetical protein
MEATMADLKNVASLIALERLVGIALDQALKPEEASWAREVLAAVFRAASGRVTPCNCNSHQVAEQVGARKRRAATKQGW